MRRRFFTAALTLLAALLVPASSGIHYTAETTITPAQGEPQVVRVEAWVDGPKAKVVFQKSDQPMLSEGAYLLTKDGGGTIYLVDPEEETYTETDVAAVLGKVGAVMQAMKGLMNLAFSDVEVVKLGENAAGELLGYPVTHSKYRTTYTVSMKILGTTRQSTTETIQEIWATDAFGDPALGDWLGKEPPSTGMEALDEMIAAEWEKVDGFPLKTVSVSTTTSQNGMRESESRTETVVTALDEVAVPEPIFELPTGYTRSEMMQR